MGLDAVEAEWREVAGRPLLLVARYDRAGADGKTIRLHQEDFAQALGVPSNRKYAAEGGPTFRDAFALLRSAATRPAREVLKLADAAIFNLIIGNADAHAKNFSLLRKEPGEMVLVPLYDLVATHVWEELSPHLAMRFGGAGKLEEVDGKTFARFAEEAGLAPPYVRRRAEVLTQAVQAAIGKGIEVPGITDPERVTTPASTTAERAGRLELKR